MFILSHFFFNLDSPEYFQPSSRGSKFKFFFLSLESWTLRASKGIAHP